MRRLILVRHGKAEGGSPTQQDRDRSLTEAGQADARQMGEWLVAQGVTPDFVMISPAERTRATWDRLASAYTIEMTAEIDDRLYAASGDGLLDAIRSVETDPQTLMLVGHNPGIHDLAQHLVGSGHSAERDRLTTEFPPASVAIIDADIEGWSELEPYDGRLEHFVSPGMQETLPTP